MSSTEERRRAALNVSFRSKPPCRWCPTQVILPPPEDRQHATHSDLHKGTIGSHSCTNAQYIASHMYASSRQALHCPCNSCKHSNRTSHQICLYLGVSSQKLSSPANEGYNATPPASAMLRCNSRDDLPHAALSDLQRLTGTFCCVQHCYSKGGAHAGAAMTVQSW